MKEQYIRINKYGKFYYADKAMTIRHREDGPAAEYCYEYKEWYVDDEPLTEDQFNARFATVELTMDQIAAKFGIDASKLKITK